MPLPPLALLAIAVVLAIGLLIVLFKMTYKVAEPDEALIISGLGAKGATDTDGDNLGFKIVTGRGVVVIPGFQVARRLPLDLHSAPLSVECVTVNGIKVVVKGTVLYKIADDQRSIANAARRFLGKVQTMDANIHDVFSGHLRGIVGSLTVEDLLTKRDSLTNETRSHTHDELAKLGLTVQSLVFHDIDDAHNYINNLGKPQAAKVEAAARIAAAQQDREATEAEQQSEALKAAAQRETAILKAGYQAEMDAAASKAKQAGPLAEATARQEVTVQETRAAELAADLTERRLQTDVRKPADAEAYKQTTLATALRDARISAAEAQARETELAATADAAAVQARATAQAAATTKTGQAEADAHKARGLAAAAASEAQGLANAKATEAQGLAEAASIAARAQALAENQDAVIAQQIAENYPAIVQAAAGAFNNVESMVVLDGAEGVTKALSEVMTVGSAGIGFAKQVFGSMQGSAPASAPAPVPTVAPAVAPAARPVPTVTPSMPVAIVSEGTTEQE